jgi:hypothetical protein
VTVEDLGLRAQRDRRKRILDATIAWPPKAASNACRGVPWQSWPM